VAVRQNCHYYPGIKEHCPTSPRIAYSDSTRSGGTTRSWSIISYITQDMKDIAISKHMKTSKNGLQTLPISIFKDNPIDLSMPKDVVKK
jgi:hypothetical protein